MIIIFILNSDIVYIGITILELNVRFLFRKKINIISSLYKRIIIVIYKKKKINVLLIFLKHFEDFINNKIIFLNFKLFKS